MNIRENEDHVCMSELSIYLDHFEDEVDALNEVKAAKLHPVEMTVPSVCNEVHWHSFSTRLYILQGVLRITDSRRNCVLVAGPGSRVDVPARVLHCEESEGYRIVAGMSVDPASLAGPIDLPPEDL
jgi:hypothetical protein